MPVSTPGIPQSKYQKVGQKGVRDVRLSFETNDQGAVKLYFPFKVRIDKIRSIVTTALAGTDAGTVTGSNATGASATGVTSHAASAAIGDEDDATPTTNNVVNADSYYELDPEKTTGGGVVVASVEYTVIR